MHRLKLECHEKYKKLERPNAMKTRGLRRHVAIHFDNKGKKQDFEFLTRHMGHTANTHKMHYRKKC